MHKMLATEYAVQQNIGAVKLIIVNTCAAAATPVKHADSHSQGSTVTLLLQALQWCITATPLCVAAGSAGVLQRQGMITLKVNAPALHQLLPVQQQHGSQLAHA